MGSFVVFIVALTGAVVVLLVSVVLTARALDRRADRRTSAVLDAIGGLRTQLAPASPGSVRATHARGSLRLVPASQAGEGADDSGDRPAIHPIAPPPGLGANVSAFFRGPFIRDRLRAPSSSPSPTQPQKDAIAARWTALCIASEAAGQPATHGNGADCFRGLPEVDVCTCACAACQRATALLAQAQEEP